MDHQTNRYHHYQSQIQSTHMRRNLVDHRLHKAGNRLIHKTGEIHPIHKTGEIQLMVLTVDD